MTALTVRLCRHPGCGLAFYHPTATLCVRHRAREARRCACGAEITAGAERCRACVAASRRGITPPRRRQNVRRDAAIIEASAAGDPPRAICADLNLGKNVVAGAIDRARNRGELPPPDDPDPPARRPMEFPGHDRCQWPLWGDGPPTFEFCGEEIAAGGAVYCAVHGRRASRKLIPVGAAD